MRRIIKTGVIASVLILISCTGGIPQNKKTLKAPGAFGISPECSTLNSDKRVYKDTPFIQEYHEGYTVGEVKESNEVRSIAVDWDHSIWIATAAGAYVKASGQKKFSPVIEGEERGPAYSVKVSDDGAVWIGAWNGVYRFKNNKLQRIGGAEAPISVLCPAEEDMYAIGPKGIWLMMESQFQKQDYKIASSPRDAISDGDGGLFVTTDVRLYHCSRSGVKLYHSENELISAYIKSIATGQNGEIWIGGLGGVTIRDRNKKLRTITPSEGIPSAEVNCVRRSHDGTMWVGTNTGTVRYNPDGTHTLRFSRRWLVNDQVNDIAFDQEGNAWIATSGGVSAIKIKKMTLAGKADYFYSNLMRRHIREPWIAARTRLVIPGDTTSSAPKDDDNDGQYTGMYLVMESLRYAVTKNEDAHVKAGKAFDFLKLLQEITQTDGFFARTVVPAHWKDMQDRNRTYTDKQLAEELVREPRAKPVETRWHRSKDGKWLWKGDTSSDEMCGHMFGYYFFHEYAANAEERKIIAAHVKKIMDYLMANNYTLVDVDGKHTCWGVWSPDKLNRDDDWLPERAINSLELLSYLKLTYYLTGDEKYQKEYLRLIRDENYLENAKKINHPNPAFRTYIDPELTSLVFPALYRCETDPEIKKELADLLEGWFETLKENKSPLYNMIYVLLTHKDSDLNSSVQFLIDTPLDLVDWHIDHSVREDIQVVRKPILEVQQSNKYIPADIRATVRWDRNPWVVKDGSDTEEREPVFWLLPYWIGRYTGLIN